MSIFVLIRHSANWSAIQDLDNFVPEHNLSVSQLYQWKRTYGMSWIEYRKELVDIANHSHKTVRAEDVLVCENKQHGRFKEVRFVKNVPFTDSDIIIPFDDDDWLYPNLKLDQSVDVNFWNAEVYETVTSSSFHSWHPHHSEWCANGYAIRFSALKNLNPFQLANVLLYHDYAAPVCFHCKMTWRYHDKPLSVYVRHPGSSSVIKNGDVVAKSLPDKKTCKAIWALDRVEKYELLFNRLAKEKPLKMM
jgi:hypothetical protein